MESANRLLKISGGYPNELFILVVPLDITEYILIQSIIH